MGVIRTYTDAIVNAKPAFDGIEDCPVSFEREKYFALQICERNTALQNTNMLPSLAHAVRNVALCGITLNPAMKLAYLVPRKGQVCLDISYMGLIKIATDSGSVTHVNCQLVYEKDEFELTQGTTESLVHKPVAFGDRGKLIGVYTIATLHNGEKLIETMSRGEVEQVRTRSKAKSGPWMTDYNEMARKTCVKRASKYWPKTERLAEAVQTLHDHEGYADITPPEPIVEMADEAFEKNLPTYTKLIESGDKSASELIAFLSSKKQITEKQCETLNNITEITEAEVVK